MATTSHQRFSIQQQCLSELALLAPPPDSTSEDVVVFEVNARQLAAVPVVRLYCLPLLAQQDTSSPIRSVAQTPRWLHTVLRQQLLAIYEAGMPAEFYLAASYIVGDPIVVPSPEVLESALQLWRDGLDGSYAKFSDALTAARLLV